MRSVDARVRRYAVVWYYATTWYWRAHDRRQQIVTAALHLIVPAVAIGATRRQWHGGRLCSGRSCTRNSSAPVEQTVQCTM